MPTTQIEHARSWARLLREADDRQEREGVTTALCQGSPDRKKLLLNISEQAKLRIAGKAAMADEAATRSRLNRLLVGGEFQVQPALKEAYGLSDGGLAAAKKHVQQWSTRSNRPFAKGPLLSRWVLEAFYSTFDILLPRQAAARLSMTPESLARVLKFAGTKLGIPPQSIGADGIGISKNVLENLHRSFAALSNTVFGDHSSYCRALHKAFQSEGIQIEAVYDETSQEFGERPTDLTYYIDVVTLRPIGVKYTVWLDLGKPMNLEPDHISILTLARFEQVLAPRVMSQGIADERMLEIARAIVGR